ncbi:F-box only protein 16 [Channa argus]|uniref:F-box only protein 16 n=1 Tax=Channa argus TaxID=215402 RepID=A0A6G1QJE9_CHAAH|nr:F-box only protein 16 [Channa argus]
MKQTERSAWTPLNNVLANSKVFEERRRLLAKWAADFTCLLPRALSLYLFSFLDPRSLSRCAQVSWHWRSIVELDQLWMPKCVRLNWCINFSPTPFEQGVWKRHYIQKVQELQFTPPQVVVPDVTQASSRHDNTSDLTLFSEAHPASTSEQLGSSSRVGSRKEKQSPAPPPWRDSDRHPKDTLRFNYLDNLVPLEQALKAPMKSRATSHHSSITLKPDRLSKKPLSEVNYKLRKAKSLGGDNCGGFSGDCATTRHHVLCTGIHANDELLRGGSDRGESQIMLIMGFQGGGGGGGKGEIEDTLAFNIQALVKSSYMYFNAWMFLRSDSKPNHPLPQTQTRPQWASHSNKYPVTKETVESLLRQAQWNAGIRPRPVRSAVPQLSVGALRAFQRSHRSPPSK